MLISLKLQNIRVSLTRIVERYNFIQNKTEKCEFDIIAQQMDDIDLDLKLLTDEYTWIDYGNKKNYEILFSSCL